MKTYKYTDATNAVVHVIDEDGISRTSMLASALPSETVIEPADPPPPIIISSVTMRQARLALLAAGKLGQVAAAIASLPSPAKEQAQIEWEYSITVERNRPFVLQLGAALGLDDAALDALFTAAAQL